MAKRTKKITKKVSDQIPDLGVTVPDTKRPASIPTVMNPVLGYTATRYIGRGQFYTPEYDLSEIGRIEDSIAGHRCTVIRNIDNSIEVLPFEELYNRFSVSAEHTDKDRIFNPQVFALTLFEEKPTWKPIKTIIRHKVNKTGFTIYQKVGFTTVTADHSLIEKDTLESSNPYSLFEKQKQIARVLGEIPRQIDESQFIDIAPFLEGEKLITILEDKIKYKYQGDKNRNGIVRELTIPRFLEKRSLLVVLGAYLSEGSVTLDKNTNNFRGFMIHNSNRPWLETIQKEFNKLFGKISSIKTYESMSRLICNRILISTLFANMAGYGSENKKLPSFCFSLSQENAQILIKYLVDGDGHRETFGWSYTTKSIRLSAGYSTLLRCLGINHTFNYRRNHGRTYYSIRTNLHFEQTSKCKTTLDIYDFKNEYVYDLEVADSHMFVDAAGQILLHNTDSYVRQSFNKKTALMFKEGWDLVGKNTRIIKYVRSRLAQVAQASSTPIDKFLRDLGASLIRKSNAFVIKVRKTAASGGKIRVTPDGKTLQPIAAYFIAPAESMEFQVNNGKIVKWRQNMPDGMIQEYAPQDVVHIYMDRKDGFIFGTPVLVPVVDDIRALRKIEENIELLIYQHLFPLFQYKVGTETAPAGFTETGEREIDVVRREIQYMPTEGGIVTPERHEILAIGAEGRALRANEYLEHFKRRVFSGLGLSAVDYGEGNTANRATADSMSRLLIDSVKDMQQIFEIFVNRFLVEELLLESTFGEEVLDEENRCYLRFKEIDLEVQIKKNAHYSDMFTKQIITWDEARQSIGFEPIRVPSPEEAQSGEDLVEQFPEWHRTYWKLFEEPKALINASDEPYTATAVAAAENRATAVSPANVKQAGEEQTAAEVEKIKAKPVPKPAPRKDNVVHEMFLSVREDIVRRISLRNESDPNWLGALIRTQMESVVERFVGHLMTSFREGFSKGSADMNLLIEESSSVRLELNTRANEYITKLITDLINSVKRQFSNADPQTIVMQIRGVFDSLEYRTNFLEDVEFRRAFNYGKLRAAIRNGQIGAVDYICNSEDCMVCKTACVPTSPYSITLDSIGPHHPNCQCTMTFIPLSESKKAVSKADLIYERCLRREVSRLSKTHPNLSESTLELMAEARCNNNKMLFISADEEDLYSEDSYTSEARKHFMAIHPSLSPDEIDEMADEMCHHVKNPDPRMLAQDSESIDNLSDGAKLERYVLHVKVSLQKRRPTWSPEKLTSVAWAICNTTVGKSNG